ncbi:MAG: alkaline phosphatase family protein [Candidatus Saliniplasma sp.]
MGFLDKLLGRDFKTVVLALDGVPYSFVKDMYNREEFKHLGSPKYLKMSSVHPTVSSVAWSSFMTGKNPGKHGVYGYVDRKKGSEKLHIPDSSDLRSQTLWEHLSEKKKKVFVMNVPMTYPPRKVNGKIVSGFLCSDLKKGTYPKEFASELYKLGYKIDADSSLALENLDKFLSDIDETLESKKRTIAHYINDNWDFMMFHFMVTDRINHFMFGNYLDEGRYKDKFVKFYKRIDHMVGQVEKKLDENDKLLVVSDHGFTKMEQEVQLNRWLMEEGYLEEVNDFSNISRDTKAFSLLPGRLYINLEGREKNGGVPKDEYHQLREELIQKLNNLRDPMSGREVVENVFKREDLYSGPYKGKAPDILVHPKNGYDFKSKFGNVDLMSKGLRNGMHTYDDAFVYSSEPLSGKDPNIVDLYPTILKMMKIKAPKNLDGKALL